MSTMPAVIVKKGGFFSALAVGFFTFLTVGVVCASVVGLYGMHIVNSKTWQVLQFGSSIAEQLPNWQRALPPALAEAIQDRRDPAYREQLKVTTRLNRSRDSERGSVVIEVSNTGDEAVSLLALRLVLQDELGTPVHEIPTYAATPLTIEGEWRGPILPGSTRRFVRHYRAQSPVSEIAAEITELRVWDKTAATAASAGTASAGAEASAELSSERDAPGTGKDRAAGAARTRARMTDSDPAY